MAHPVLHIHLIIMIIFVLEYGILLKHTLQEVLLTAILFCLGILKGMLETHQIQFKLHACDRIQKYKQNAFCVKQISLCVQKLEPSKHCTFTALPVKPMETDDFEMSITQLTQKAQWTQPLSPIQTMQQVMDKQRDYKAPLPDRLCSHVLHMHTTVFQHRYSSSVTHNQMLLLLSHHASPILNPSRVFVNRKYF